MSVTVPGLNPTTEADQSAQEDRIHSNSLNVTRVGGVAALIAAVAAAAAPIFPISANDPVALQVTYAGAKGAVIVASLIMAAVIISADVRARATVASVPADRGAGAVSAGASAGGGAAVPASVAATPMIGLPQPLRVRVAGVGPATALALRVKVPDEFEYLVAHAGDKLTWVGQAGVEIPASPQAA